VTLVILQQLYGSCDARRVNKGGLRRSNLIRRRFDDRDDRRGDDRFDDRRERERERRERERDDGRNDNDWFVQKEFCSDYTCKDSTDKQLHVIRQFKSCDYNILQYQCNLKLLLFCYFLSRASLMDIMLHTTIIVVCCNPNLRVILCSFSWRWWVAWDGRKLLVDLTDRLSTALSEIYFCIRCHVRSSYRSSVACKYLFHNITIFGIYINLVIQNSSQNCHFSKCFHKVGKIYLVFFFKILDLYLLQLKSNKKLVLISLFFYISYSMYTPLLIKQIHLKKSTVVIGWLIKYCITSLHA
jgi:hypothetical protein